MARAPRPRRARSATESLLSIVLVLEAVLVFFVTLVVYGLRALQPGIAFGAGAALLVVLLLTSLVVRFRGGLAFGFLLQAVLIASGLLVTLMYVIGAIFAAIWVYCYVRGRTLDRNNAALAASTQGENA